MSSEKSSVSNVTMFIFGILFTVIGFLAVFILNGMAGDLKDLKKEVTSIHDNDLIQDLKILNLETAKAEDGGK